MKSSAHHEILGQGTNQNHHHMTARTAPDDHSQQQTNQGPLQKTYNV